ncbi:MAG: LLM class flavin-dependent oxidoreductase, partial [Chloroflexi bacterium]|nr:LLM class flavin-dependent oxidoreductase [Chloroflexota bacterium]
QPHTILALPVLCAATDEQADELAVLLDLAFLRRQRGQRAPLPTLVEAKAYSFTPLEQAQVRANRARLIIGSPTTVQTRIETFVRQTQADEVMILTMIAAHEARLRSYELLAEAFALTPAERVNSLHDS